MGSQRISWYLTRSHQILWDLKRSYYNVDFADKVDIAENVDSVLWHCWGNLNTLITLGDGWRILAHLKREWEWCGKKRPALFCPFSQVWTKRGSGGKCCLVTNNIKILALMRVRRMTRMKMRMVKMMKKIMAILLETITMEIILITTWNSVKLIPSPVCSRISETLSSTRFSFSLTSLVAVINSDEIRSTSNIEIPTKRHNNSLISLRRCCFCNAASKSAI